MGTDPHQFIEIFKSEAGANLKTLEQGIVRLEKNGTDQTLMDDLFRAAHTLKGNARMMGFADISEAAHRLEDLFGRLKEGTGVMEPGVVDTVLEAIDKIKSAVENTVNGQPKTPEPTPSLEKKKEPTQDVPPQTSESVASKPVASGREEDETIRVPLSRINNLLNLTGEIVVSKVKSTYKVDLFKKLYRQTGSAERMLFDLKALIKEALGVSDEWIQHQGMVLRASKELEQASRLFSHLHQIELVVSNVRQGVSELTDQVQTEVFRLNPVIEELQQRMKEIRMLPCSIIFEGFPRLIRDIAKNEKKAVRLQIEGEKTELDKKVLESIKGPLIHILRNAIDHGIETLADRPRTGKPETAIIQLSAFQEGGKVVITVSDDGKGIDLDAVKATALKRHLVGETDLREMGNAELINLIFAPGFSTAPIITDVSGRGVGLDVVKNEMDHLKGSVSVSSEKGKGTMFRLELPLTIAILDVLLVEAGARKWALPISGLKETLRISQDQISTIQNRMMISYRDKSMPVIMLSEILGMEHKSERQSIRRFQAEDDKDHCVLVLQSFGKQVGLIVEQVFGEDEVFIKGFGAHLGRIQGVSGAAVLATGEAVIILDPCALIQDSHLAHPAARARQLKAKTERKKVLLVEDSLTTRELERTILENGGYEVETAIDGLNALEKLSKVWVDAIVSDIKMPRMDGFELCRSVKTQDKLKDIPFIFVSSLAKEEEKRKGMDVGAQAYIIKSQFDQSNLLDTIGRLVA